MRENPKIFRVETGLINPDHSPGTSTADILDYPIYKNIPKWWRRIESLLRLDVYLAFRAKKIENQYDIIWAGSEKVGIPVSFLRLQKPLVVVTHYLESSLKSRFARATAIVQRWAGIGYFTNESKEFLVNYLDAPEERLFECGAAKYLGRVQPGEVSMVCHPW